MRVLLAPLLLALAASSDFDDDDACPSKGGAMLQRASKPRLTAVEEAADDEKPMAYWNFEEGERSIPDVSGNGRTLSCEAGFRGSRYFANAEEDEGLGKSRGLAFPSGASATADVAGFRSLSFFMKAPLGCCGTVRSFVSASGEKGRFFLAYYSWGNLVVRFYKADGRSSSVAVRTQRARKEAYVHIAAVFADREVQLYVDGEKAGSRSAPFEEGDVDVGPLKLQLGTGRSWYQFRGHLDEVQVFHSALPSGAVQALSKATGFPPSKNAPPVASAGEPQTVTDAATSLELKGKCTDPDSSALTAAWRLVSSPAGAVVALDDASKLAPTVALQKAAVGDYAFRLTCSDGKLSSSASVTVFVAVSSALLAHWRFDEPVGTRFVRDEAGMGHALELKASSVQHPCAELRPNEGLGGGGAVRFYSRSAGMATVPRWRTLSFWMKRELGCCSRMNSIVQAMRVGEDAQPFFHFYLVFGAFQARVTKADGSHVYVKVPLPPAQQSVWQHVAVTMHDDKMVMYLDGREVKSTEAALSEEALGPQALETRVGVHAHHPFLGLVDEIRLYREAVSPETVAAIAAAKNGELLPDEVELLADAGPAQSLWKPAFETQLKGSCTEGATATWSTKSSPDEAELQGDGAEVKAVLKRDAKPGDYVFSLRCEKGGASRSSEVTVALFEAHEERTGATVRTDAEKPGDFAEAGKAVKPVALFAFDGDGSNAAGGEAAKGRITRGKAELDFTAEGRFGGGVGLHCKTETGNCVQLDLGNSEAEPFKALTVSFWFKATTTRNAFFRKGNFFTRPPGYKADVWHHFVQTQDEEMKKVYMDGVLIYISNFGLTIDFLRQRTTEDAADPMSFGIRSGHPAYGFDGILDDLAVYDFMVSNDEVELLHAQGAGAFTRRLAGNPRWRGAYSTAMLRDFFPEREETTVYEGFFRDPAKKPLPSYVHPRIFFAPEELPDLRKRLRESPPAYVGWESMMSRLKGFFPYEKLETRNLTLKEVHFGMAQDFIFEAFRCLVVADRAGAERLGQQMDALADEQLPKMRAYDAQKRRWQMGDRTGYDESDTWRLHHHNVVLRLATAFVYDFIYPYLTEGTRGKMRAVLAYATTKTWSIGMDAIPAGVTSNWHSWCTGDLVLNLIAIEGEDGFDEGVYQRASESYSRWLTNGVSPVSGATYEGGGKNAMTGSKLLVMAMHGYPQFVAGEAARKHVRQFLLHTMLPNGDWFEDDLWGGIEKKSLLGDIGPLKFAYPEDKVADYVYHMAMEGSLGNSHAYHVGLPYRSITDPRPSVYTYNNHVMDIIYATSLLGPEDKREHARFSLSDQPLTYLAKDRGLMVARSSWGDEDAAWLLFNVRSLHGGHAAPARGGFAFYALGQVFSWYHTGHNKDSNLHSIVMVDGEGQNTATGKFLSLADGKEATWGSCDLRLAYGHAQIGNMSTNSFLIEKSPFKWHDLPLKLLPHWYTGINFARTGEAAGQNFRRAFRTAGLVRAERPYALVFDDFQKDEETREYKWRMMLKPYRPHLDFKLALHKREKVDYLNIEANGNDFVVPGDDGKRFLLVRMLPGSSPGQLKAELSDNKGPQPVLTFTSVVPAARFRVLLYPFKEGEALPETSWDEASGQLKVGADALSLEVSEEGLTSVKETKVGGPLAEHIR